METSVQLTSDEKIILESHYGLQSGGYNPRRLEAVRNLTALEKLEQQMALLNDHFGNDSELWRLACLLYVGQLVEQAGLLYSLNEQYFCQLLADNKKDLLLPPV